MIELATPEEIAKVRKTECATQGHRFETLMPFGKEAPDRVLCSNCGASWRVVPEALLGHSPQDEPGGGLLYTFRVADQVVQDCRDWSPPVRFRFVDRDGGGIDMEMQRGEGEGR